jgi:4-diphosphocytidyl-2-C-methyl-D-erythritol kinase
MAEIVRVEAPAKINVHLRVYRRRDDGFHGILSLFQAVSLSDLIVIRSLKEFDVLEIEGKLGCPAERSTVFRAASAYRELTGSKAGLAIRVEKRIPIGAGLGGGSSDAAATLIGLERLLHGGLGRGDLARAAARIGSDVPFFLQGGAAVVSGRGEVIAPIPDRTDYRLVIVYPGVSVSTAEAYGMLDRERPDDSSEADPDAAELARRYRGTARDWVFSNSFEPVICSAHSEIAAARGELLGLGADFAAMSGSGSAVFGVFEDGERAAKARDAMGAGGREAYLAAPLARLPALV